MRINRKTIGMSLLSIGLMIAISGCSATGSKFVKPKAPTKNKGMLYVYRPSSLFGAGMYYDVRVDGKVIGTVRNGGYIAKELSLGKKTLSAKTEAVTSIPIIIRKNQTTCVKAGIGLGVLVGRATLKVLDNATCFKEIKGTKQSFD